MSQLAHTSILLFCHSGLDPESRAILRFFRFWMPDQVRHDGQNSITFLNYDTASKAGIQWFLFDYETCSGFVTYLLKYLGQFI